MRHRARTKPSPLTLSFAALVGFLLVVTVLASIPQGGSPDAVAGTRPDHHGTHHRGRVRAPERAAVVPALRKEQPWSGYAFDACRTPSQAVMDRWRTTSPFTGVGVYLGGVQRACEQRYLTPRWVAAQIRAGWKLLPIWVGPQASCTGYDHRIPRNSGRLGRYIPARLAGAAEARRAVATARGLGVPRGEVLFYDIEPFSTAYPLCRGSSLAFLEQWTKELHRRGYRSGVYSTVGAAISLISRAGGDYVGPDATWYAWIGKTGVMPTDYVADGAFMRSSRVHQYALDSRVEFGGVQMDIDWDYVNLGSTTPPARPGSCDRRASQVRPERVGPGSRGPLVRVLQCLVLPGDVHPLKTSGRVDPPTVRAVRSYQHRSGLPATGTVDRRTWASLLAHGATPVLRRGSSGSDVARLQRTLNVAQARPKIAVDGAFGAATARAVRHYRSRIGLRPDTVVTPGVWHALVRGRVVTPPAKSEPPAHPKAPPRHSPKHAAHDQAAQHQNPRQDGDRKDDHHAARRRDPNQHR